nr:MAG TPA: hypothetical protein [Caudoviricetes sp.]
MLNQFLPLFSYLLLILINFVILEVFYLPVLIVSYKFGIHFHLHLSKMSNTLGNILF